MLAKKNSTFVNNFSPKNLVVSAICVNTHTKFPPPSYLFSFTKIEIAKISIFCKIQTAPQTFTTLPCGFSNIPTKNIFHLPRRGNTLLTVGAA